jgi:UDP-glucuronate 4-epimerase
MSIIKARINEKNMLERDVTSTYADITDLNNETGFITKTSIEEGLKKIVDWNKDYYKV